MPGDLDTVEGEDLSDRPTRAAYDELNREKTELERRLRHAQDAAATSDRERAVAEARFESQSVKLDALTSALARLHLQIEDLERDKAEIGEALHKAETELSKTRR